MESLLSMSGWILSGLLAVALLWLGIEWNRARLSRNESVRELYRYQQTVELLVSFLEKGALGTDPEAFWEAFLDCLRRLIRAGSGAIYLLRNQQLELERMAGPFPPPISVPNEVAARIQFNLLERANYLKSSPISLDAPVCVASVARTGKPELVADTRSDPRFPSAGQGTLRTDSYLAIPLVTNGQVFGVIALAHREGGTAFSQADLARGISLAAQAALLYQLRCPATEERPDTPFEKKLPKVDLSLPETGETPQIVSPLPEVGERTELRPPSLTIGKLPAEPVTTLPSPSREPVVSDALPRVSGFEVAARTLSAGERGGDFYDFIPVSGRHWGIALGDVCGKSLPASVLMTSCRALLRARAPGVISPSDVLREINRSLFGEVPEDMFLTLLYCVIDEETGEIRLARAGHELPVWYRGSGRPAELVRIPGLALGIDSGEIFDGEVSDVAFRLAPGELLFFYTDGVYETRNAQGKEFGRENLLRLVERAAGDGPARLLEEVLREIRQFRGDLPQEDDITVVAIRRET
ncbi:GAF domain-containing SpoIIE family protein phosphatase [Candidatus Methylacidithermus pantelleriae]|uniref:Putative Phosphoserine phosphatase n=1 Tax=Candidatus Methylacidithermus pantelleriae TaxID=2744239 RepID=A0A8J2BKQ2_9BACT|nr:GAF domain-containing SpoIIE family protein phosphatase [Candidatus Methylacidithermus pantelleriae]CAF0700808.1 putative Phosphoserine phosphatase [Candidatus Methylacidithermus pantelleriae]